MGKIKVITATHLIAAGTVAGTYDVRQELGKEVVEILGYYANVVKNGGITPEQCLVSFSNGSRTIFEPTGLGHLMVNSAVAIKDRFFKEEPFDVSGYLNTRITTPATVGTDLMVQYMLLVKTTN